jgi:hypothetical protein
MKIFISWAKDGASHEVAVALHEWLACVIQAAHPFVSDLDIVSGQRWAERLADELRHTDYGIVCVTAGSLNSPWLNWEAGAISKGGDKALIFPFLFRVEQNKVSGPLEQFQFTVYDDKNEEYNKKSMLKLVGDINKRVDEPSRMSEEVLNATFNKWWSELREKLDKITIPPPPVHKPSWLSGVDDLDLRQGHESCKEVWVITPDLKRQSLCDRAIKLLRRNLARGVAYKYLVPNTDASINSEKALRLALSECGCPPEVIFIEEKVFDLLVATTYVLINPEKGRVEAWFEAPTDERGNWVKVSTEAALNFNMRFRELINARAEFVEALRTVIHVLDEDHDRTVGEESQAASPEATPAPSLPPEP